MAGQNGTPSARQGGGYRQAPWGYPGNSACSALSLWELPLSGLRPSHFLDPTQSCLVLSLSVLGFVWLGVMGVRGVPGLGCPAEAWPGMTPKLIMCLAVGRDPGEPQDPGKCPWNGSRHQKGYREQQPSCCGGCFVPSSGAPGIPSRAGKSPKACRGPGGGPHHTPSPRSTPDALSTGIWAQELRDWG